MRRLEYREFLRQKKERVRENLEALVELKGKKPCRRPRDPEEREALIQFDLLRWQSWLKKGILEKTGNKRFKLDFSRLKKQ